MKESRIRWMSRLGVVLLLVGWLAVWSDYTAVTSVMETRPAALALLVAATGLLFPGALRSRSLAAGTGVALSLLGVAVAIYLLLFAYGEETIRFESGELTLSGTLYTPRGESASAGVVFIDGSGESTGEYFRWYAKQFARRGIASLIYHKRGSGESEGDLWDSTYHDYAGDAASAVRWMQQSEAVPSNAVGLFGHSEGGWVASISAFLMSQPAALDDAASPSPEARGPAFIIVSSTTPMTAAEQVLFQTGADVRGAGFDNEISGQAMSLQARVLEYQRTGRSDPELKRELENVREEPWFDAAGLPAELYQPEEYAWWRSVMDIDVRPYWANVDVPVLALSGGRDRNSDVRASQAELEHLLKAGGNEHFTGVVFPEAEHGLVEWWLPGRVPPPRYPSGLGDLIVDWIGRQVSDPP